MHFDWGWIVVVVIYVVIYVRAHEYSILRSRDRVIGMLLHELVTNQGMWMGRFNRLDIIGQLSAISEVDKVKMRELIT